MSGLSSVNFDVVYDRLGALISLASRSTISVVPVIRMLRVNGLEMIGTMQADLDLLQLGRQANLDEVAVVSTVDEFLDQQSGKGIGW